MLDIKLEFFSLIRIGLVLDAKLMNNLHLYTKIHDESKNLLMFLV